MARLEHVNITVKDPQATADMLHDIFGWTIRWQGESIYGGETIHVGEEATYLALYSPAKASSDRSEDSYTTRGGLNHIGVVVDDLDATEAKILARGFKTGSHQDYEPGRRFYFDDADGIEVEVISYA